MHSAPLPPNENARLKALQDLEILDTEEEPDFDDLTQLAAQIFDAPVSLISLIDSDRQFLKSHYGIAANHASRETGFCPHAILLDEVTIIEDTLNDTRFFDNPNVAGGPGIRFYAGAPLVLKDDIRIGTLCVMDFQPRTITPEQVRALVALARQAVSQLKHRKTLREHWEVNRREHNRSKVLEQLARGESLDHLLHSIVTNIEDEIDGSVCSILLLDETRKHLILGAAPHLPDFYNRAINNIEIGPDAGSCGSAAYYNRVVIAEDIRVHPNWAPYREVAERAGLLSCWSHPVVDANNKVLGTFAIYFPEPKATDDALLANIESAADLASIAIEHTRVKQQEVAARKEAEEASQAKSRFLSRMSHELRTPLNAVIGFSQLLMVDDALTPEHKEHVSDIMKGGNHLLSLINEVLDLARIEAGKMSVSFEPVELQKVCDTCISLVRSMQEERNITIQCRDLEGLFVRADRTRVKQVVLNLLSNAVKYNRDGGQVILHATVYDDVVRLTVSDTGWGIEETSLQEVFEAFNRLGRDNGNIEGTGIGLTLTRQLVELMNGQIGVESRLGEGSQFWIELEKDVGIVAKKESQSGVVASSLLSDSERTILYIEDNPANMKLIETLFGRYENITLYSASTPYQGLEIAAEKKPDIILLDINLPDMDGYEVLQRLKQNQATCDIPVIAVTANTMPEDVKKINSLSFENYLAKPLDLKRLEKVVDELLV